MEKEQENRNYNASTTPAKSKLHPLQINQDRLGNKRLIQQTDG
jgi:hypothetical protein